MSLDCQMTKGFDLKVLTFVKLYRTCKPRENKTSDKNASF